MENRKLGHRGTRSLTALIAALTAAILLAMPAFAATVTASDVMIRNSGEEKDDNIIGSLDKGDKVTVISRTVDASGTEWYYIELPNKNTGYVKAKWIDNGGKDVKLVESAPQEEADTQDSQEEEEAEEEDAGQEAAEAEDDEDGLDDWTDEDAEKLSEKPVSKEKAASGKASGSSEKDEEVSKSQDEFSAVDENAYNPFTDPDAQYSIDFIKEKDGTGNWYVYSIDLDKRIRLQDTEKMNELQQAAQKSAASAGIWRTIACVFLIILIGLLVFLYIVIKRNTRTPVSPRSRRRQRARYDEDEDDSSDEEDDDFSYAAESEEDGQDPEASEEEPEKDEEESAQEENDAPADVSDDYMGAATARAALYAGDSEDKEADEGDGGSDLSEEDESEEDSRISSFEDDEDDGEYGEEDYEEDDSYDSEEDAPRRGGFFGFLKNMFHTAGGDYEEDDDMYEDEEDEEEDEDAEDAGGAEPEEEAEGFEEDGEDYEEDYREVKQRGPSRGAQGAGRSRERQQRRAVSRRYDETLDYPEDAELLPDPAHSSSSADAVKPARQERIQAPDVEEQDEDFYADDEDDMEYSFLNSKKHRSGR